MCDGLRDEHCYLCRAAVDLCRTLGWPVSYRPHSLIAHVVLLRSIVVYQTPQSYPSVALMALCHHRIFTQVGHEVIHYIQVVLR